MEAQKAQKFCSLASEVVALRRRAPLAADCGVASRRVVAAVAADVAQNSMASSAQSLISPEGLRQDGRRVGEIRRLRCRLGAAPRADGSAYAEMGNTKVLATVCGPHEARRPGEQLDCAALTCELSALPFAGGAHRPQGRGDRGSVDSPPACATSSRRWCRRSCTRARRST